MGNDLEVEAKRYAWTQAGIEMVFSEVEKAVKVVEEQMGEANGPEEDS